MSLLLLAMFGVAESLGLRLLTDPWTALEGRGRVELAATGVAPAHRFLPAEERRRAESLLRRWGAPVVVATRPVPILAECVAVLAGTTSMRWRRFIAAAVAGAVPAAFLYATAGAAVARVDSGLLVFGLVMAIAAAAWFAGRWVDRRSDPPVTDPLTPGRVNTAGRSGSAGTR